MTTKTTRIILMTIIYVEEKNLYKQGKGGVVSDWYANKLNAINTHYYTYRLEGVNNKFLSDTKSFMDVLSLQLNSHGARER